ncbi:4Fe-4S cluster-binding domain-containing protein [Insolitispirillum peregrinum]|uniref:4Fe-4S cluster-binding domain-containing protein n=1 Tax=Insolitispirillum peregrinum TaxID=80876 RepID=UPI003609855E
MMNLNGHLLYLDITQICGVDCSFCMYAEKHRNGINFQMSDTASQNLRALINDRSVKRVSISGEGEPLNNAAVFHQILQLSEGNQAFEFISSGFWPHDMLADFIEVTDRLVHGNRDTCNIRLSCDSYHVEKVRHKPHGFSLDFWLRTKPESLSLSFRSVDTDREFARAYLLEQVAQYGWQGHVTPHGELDDILWVGERSFRIDYKNHVHPSAATPPGYLDLKGYISALEAKVGKPFTLGSLNPHPSSNGIDLTMKPDGRVYLYGAENDLLGNIHHDEFTWDGLCQRIADTPLLRQLYTTPLQELLSRFDGDLTASRIISEANNPYWVVKELSQEPNLVERMIAS